jgi:hypothetical protein
MISGARVGRSNPHKAFTSFLHITHVEKKERLPRHHNEPGAAVSNSNLYIGSQERLMSFNVKADVAECYRRAEEYKRLYHRASSLDEREIYLSTRRQFLRLAEDLETRAGPKAKRSA